MVKAEHIFEFYTLLTISEGYTVKGLKSPTIP